MRLYDTHFHLDLQKDIKGAIEEINNHKIYTIAMTNLPALYEKELQYMSPYIRIGLGFHPELVREYKKYIPLMWKKMNEARYIGEVGLDFTDSSSKVDQLDFFSELVDRCRYDQNKIMSIHSRKAEKEVLDILGDNFAFKAIFHWFSGSMEHLKDAVKKGCYFSINANMVNSKRFEAIMKVVPANRVLLETDSPFGTFIGIHHKILEQIVSKISQKLHILPEEGETLLWENFRELLK